MRYIIGICLVLAVAGEKRVLAAQLKQGQPVQRATTKNRTVRPFSLYRWVDQLREIQKELRTHEDRFARNGKRREIMEEVALQVEATSPCPTPVNTHQVAEHVALHTNRLDDFLYHFVFNDMSTLVSELRSIYPHAHIPDRANASLMEVERYKREQVKNPLPYVISSYLEILNIGQISSSIEDLMNRATFFFPGAIHDQFNGVREAVDRLTMAPPNNNRQRKAIVDAHPVIVHRWNKLKGFIDKFYVQALDPRNGAEPAYRDYVETVHHLMHLDERASLSNLSPIWMDHVLTSMHDEGERAVNDTALLRSELQAIRRSVADGTALQPTQVKPAEYVGVIKPRKRDRNGRRAEPKPYFGNATQPVVFMPTNVEPEARGIIERLAKVSTRWLPESQSPTLRWWKIMFQRFGEAHQARGYTVEGVMEFIADVLGRLPSNEELQALESKNLREAN